MMTNENANGGLRSVQQIYAELGDDQLLNLLRGRDDLTDVGQQVLDAEVALRGLELPADDSAWQGPPDMSEEPAPTGSDLVFLMRLSLASEVEAVSAQLKAADIPLDVDPVGQSEASTTGAYFLLFVTRERLEDAVSLLRKSLGYFPVAEVDQRIDASSESEGDEGLFPLGDFEMEAAETVKQALSQAGIWFREEPAMTGRDQVTGLPEPERTFLEVRFDDLPQATQLIDQAFPAA